MKVLQINSVIDYGSTGRITRDLYDFLESKGHECVIAFGRGKSTPGYNTIKIGSNIDQFIHGVYSRLTDRHGFGSKLATKKFINQIDDYKPDLIQLHNIHGYYINIQILFDYLFQKDIPVVWLLHDQWAVSGHSAYFELNLDGSFPEQLPSRKKLSEYPKTIGVSQFEKNLKDKKRIFTSVNNMTIVTPSNWLTNMIKKTFLNRYQIKTIYNGIDRNMFYIDNSNAGKLKKEWGSENKVVILGVASVWEERKGLNDFVQLSKLLPNEKYQIVLIGIDNKTRTNLPKNIISIERTNSIDELRDIYNASDVFVNPTYFDNFPTVNLEALACGTPVITYDTGGSSESINEETGSVVKQGDIHGLISKIRNRGNKTNKVSQICSDRILNNFSKELVYSKYLDLYLFLNNVNI